MYTPRLYPFIHQWNHDSCTHYVFSISTWIPTDLFHLMWPNAALISMDKCSPHPLLIIDGRYIRLPRKQCMVCPWSSPLLHILPLKLLHMLHPTYIHPNTSPPAHPTCPIITAPLDGGTSLQLLYVLIPPLPQPQWARDIL